MKYLILYANGSREEVETDETLAQVKAWALPIADVIQLGAPAEEEDAPVEEESDLPPPVRKAKKKA